jgi:spore coat protein U-like protein
MTARALVVAGVIALLAQPAVAQTCSFGITNEVFGNVDVITGGAVDTTATLSINCTGGVSFTTVRICPSIGAGSGGATASARQMLGPGSATLNYQLYSDAGRTTVWGSYNWAFAATPPTIDLSLNISGAGSTTRTIFGRVLSGQNTAPAGSYVSNFTAADTNFVYAPLGVLPCPNLLVPQTAHPTFSATATVVSTCLVSAQDVDFGSRGVLSANIDAAGQVSVTCTPSTSYTIGLGGGNANAAPGARKMAKGAETITYGLYQDAARTQLWGSTIGTDTIAGTGNGLAQNLAVYGRVPAQTTPSAGSYTDTIVVTITY